MLKLTGDGANVTFAAVPMPVRATVCGLPEASSAMLTLALLAPVAVGPKLTPKLQLEPAFKELAPNAQAVPVVGAPRLKSPGFVPVRVMPVMLSGAVPLLVIITFVTALCVLTTCVPKGTLVGARVTAEAVPVPVSGTVCGLAGASSATLMFADLAPVAVGLKVTPTAQLELTVSELAPNAQAVPVVGAPRVKSPVFVPVRVMPVMFSVAVPLFVIVTLVVALVVPVR